MVEFAGPAPGFGNHVKIKHAGFETSYSHLSEIPESIKPGADVKQGDIIALSGNTGLSTGPHLHFEFYLNGDAVDPLPHLGAEIQSAAATLAGPADRRRRRGRRLVSWRERRGDRRLSGDKGLYRRHACAPAELIQAEPSVRRFSDWVRESPAAVLIAVDDDDRDVVARAAVERQMKEVVAGFLRFACREQRRDLLVSDMTGQSVAAQKKPIPGDRSVRRRVRVRPDRSRRARGSPHCGAARSSPPLRRAARGR